MKVSCSTAMRTEQPVGTRFLIDVREMQRGTDAPFLYAPPSASYKVLSASEVEKRFRGASPARRKPKPPAPPPTAPDAMSVEAIEGQLIEGRALRRNRNDALRRQALKVSKGVCAGCNTNFSNRFGDLGWSVLQVHHLDPIGDRVAPSVTKINELAVLCANCHAIVHADGAFALSIKDLAALLRRANSNA